MKKKDILELKKRLKKDDCTFTRMCGCYVDGEKNIVLNLNETFLTLDDDEFFKYLEIAKKTLSGTIGNNLLELEFPMSEEEAGGRQTSLMALKGSKLKEDGMLDNFYRLIIDSYDYTGNFLILVFHDAYDVIRKTTDNSKLDESEEVYEYILCAICPVSLSKPGLSYLEHDNRIGTRTRDWVVEPPAHGFLFPAFTDRSSDIHSVMYYTKNAKDPHPELMEEVLGCPSKQTAAEQKETFTNIIRNAIDDEKKSEHIFLEIQENLNNIVDEHESISDKNSDPVTLTNNTISSVLADSGIPEEITTKIEQSYIKEFGDTPPAVEHLIDSKALAANAQRKKEQRLEKKVQVLEDMLEKTKINASSQNSIENISEDDTDSAIDAVLNYDNNASLKADSNSETAISLKDEDISAESLKADYIDNDSEIRSSEMSTDSAVEAASDSESPEISNENSDSSSDYDIVLKVKPQKVSQIKSQIIDGKKYIVIPIDENEQANVNGIETVL